MKKSSLVLVALLLASPVFADNAKTEQLLTLASADTSASVNLQVNEVSELSVRLDQEVKAVSELLSSKIAAELPLISKETAVSVKF